MADTESRPDPAFVATRLRLEAALADPALRTEAHYLLWEACQACGDPQAARRHLDAAIARDPLRTRQVPGADPVRSVLLLATPGDFQANLPLGLLLDGTTLLHTLWIADPRSVLIDPERAIPPHLPAVDCVVIGIGEDRRHALALLAADALARAIGRPVINNGATIAALSREGAARLLSGISGALVPPQRAARTESLRLRPPDFPAILRPRGSHAGRSLTLLADKAALDSVLKDREPRDSFYVAPFVDYRGSDGLYRKLRIAFVAGVPYPVHLAIHDGWAVWYYNAHMERSAEKRAEEARFIDNMPAYLGSRAMRALQAIGSRLELDYAGLDCALLPDGRLLVFEVETAMLVHDRDPAEMFPYRGPGVRRIVQALSSLIDRRIADWGPTRQAA